MWVKDTDQLEAEVMQNRYLFNFNYLNKLDRLNIKVDNFLKPVFV